MESTHIVSFRHKIKLELDPSDGFATVTVGKFSGSVALALGVGQLYDGDEAYDLTDAQMEWLEALEPRIEEFLQEYA